MNGSLSGDSWTAPPLVPRMAAGESSYVVVYKPPRMHTVPRLAAPEKDSPCSVLMDWVFSRFPGIAAVRGHGENQGGLLHRLDYETRGLVLIARTSEAFTALAAQQARGEFIKEYEALSGTGEPFPGFPPRPFSGRIRYIESAFRPYGKGQRAVRPLPPERGGEKPLYRTEILSCGEGPEKTGLFRLRLARGFRHQIRCHLAWIGRPLLNDPLYGGPPFPGGFLALRACALVFTDPLTGERREYRI